MTPVLGDWKDSRDETNATEGETLFSPPDLDYQWSVHGVGSYRERNESHVAMQEGDVDAGGCPVASLLLSQAQSHLASCTWPIVTVKLDC